MVGSWAKERRVETKTESCVFCIFVIEVVRTSYQ